jgi:hypothetical protein
MGEDVSRMKAYTYDIPLSLDLLDVDLVDTPGFDVVDNLAQVKDQRSALTSSERWSYTYLDTTLIQT